jgi:hypothetical protein
MATFKGRDGTEWRVELDAPTIEEIKADHSVNLVNLESDPLGPLRNDPMLLVTVISALCREQIDAKGLKPVQFAKQLPSPPDPMLDALRDAVINFFPSGRASHIREVLAKFGQMNEKTDQITTAKMAQVINDPKVMAALDTKADEAIEKAIQSLLAQNLGT